MFQTPAEMPGLKLVDAISLVSDRGASMVPPNMVPTRSSTLKHDPDHPLFQDNSRLAQLIAQITTTNDDDSKRLVASQSLFEYVWRTTLLSINVIKSE